jgi:probable metal-binding protein
MQIEKPETHGHEVLEMMSAAGHHFSNESLQQAIDAQFGSEARFYICSGGGMDAKTLIETLWAKGKFAGTADAFIFDTEKRCNH